MSLWSIVGVYRCFGGPLVSGGRFYGRWDCLSSVLKKKKKKKKKNFFFFFRTELKQL